MKTKSTFFVGATGSFEEVTVKKWKRLRVLSHKSIGNLTNISDEVLARRSAMTQVGDIFKLAGAMIKLGFIEVQTQKNWWSWVMGKNLKDAFNYSAPPIATFIPANFIVSQGTLGTTAVTAPAASATGKILTGNFSTAVGHNQLDSDNIVVVMRNRTNGEIIASKVGDSRVDGSFSLSTVDITTTLGDILDVWSYFTRDQLVTPERSGNTSYNVVTVGA